MNKEKDKYAVPALDKAFEVLEFLAANPSPKSQAQIASGLNRSPNELYRILVNLEQKGVLIRDSYSGCYRLSLKLYNLSRTISPVDQIRQCAMPIIDDLVADVRMSCHLSMLHQSQTMVIVHVASPQAVSLNIAEGTLFSTCLSNSGKVLLACSNNEVREMILDRDQYYQSLDIQSQQELLLTLPKIREQRSLFAPSETTPGVTDFVSLIGVPDGKVVATLTVSTFQSDFSSQQNRTRVQSLVSQATASLSEQLTLISPE